MRFVIGQCLLIEQFFLVVFGHTLVCVVFFWSKIGHLTITQLSRILNRSIECRNRKRIEKMIHW